jgi:ribulose-5-phosphate 4-epimerase/fuculose-1-phosphate aldolase
MSYNGVEIVVETKQIKAEIIKYGCMLLDSRLIVGTWGNLSARIPNTDYIAITPSGKDYRTLTLEDIAVLSLSGKFIEGNFKPSSESALHLEIYNARSDIQAIVHTHSIYATACAVANQAIPPIVEDLVQLVGGGVAVAEYAICGSDQLAKNAVKALSENNAVLLANHGVVGCGTNLHEAKVACEVVEKSAQIFICANQFTGGAQRINEKDVEIMHDFYLKYYRQR